jgi:hypothetical protein
MERPLAVTAALTLAIGYAVVLVALAAAVLYEFVTGTRSMGHRNLNPAAVEGVLSFCLVLPIGALLLFRGALLLARRRDPRLMAVPLVIVFGIGCMGETIDIVGTATTRSNLIGAVILVLTALPLALLALPDSRAWTSERWSLPGRRSAR